MDPKCEGALALALAILNPRFIFAERAFEMVSGKVPNNAPNEQLLIDEFRFLRSKGCTFQTIGARHGYKRDGVFYILKRAAGGDA
jgi:hypothetical protein